MAKRKDKRKCGDPPNIQYRPESFNGPIRANEWAKLALWCVLPSQQFIGPKCLQVNNHHAIDKVLFLLVPGVRAADFLSDTLLPETFESTTLPSLNSFVYAWPTRGPEPRALMDSFVENLVKIPMTSAERMKAKTKARELENIGAPRVSFESMLLSLDKLRILEYPLEPQGDEWISLDFEKDSCTTIKNSDIYAVDCEMVVTEGGAKELARISVVNYNYEAVYQTFVKPKKPVIDYVTPYSGITPELLENVSTTLEDVQNWFRTNCSAQTVLVGHSLNFDLKALKMVFPKIIDTASLYHHPRSMSLLPGLKYLAKYYLQKDIQAGNNGHDPTIDAQTCMELLRLKLEKGPQFGEDKYRMNLAEKLAKGQRTIAVVDSNRPLWAEGHATTLKLCTSDQEIVDETLKCCGSHNVTIARLTELKDAIAQTEQSTDGTEIDTETKISLVGACLKNLDNHINRLKAEVQPNTLMIVMTEYGDTKVLKQLQRKKRCARFGPENGEEPQEFDTQDQIDLDSASKVASISASFVSLIRADCKKNKSNTDIS